MRLPLGETEMVPGASPKMGSGLGQHSFAAQAGPGMVAPHLAMPLSLSMQGGAFAEKEGFDDGDGEFDPDADGAPPRVHQQPLRVRTRCLLGTRPLRSAC